MPRKGTVPTGRFPAETSFTTRSSRSASLFTVDSNILIYSVDPRDVGKQRLARRIIGLAAGADCVVANQVIAESFHVVTRKLRMPVAEAAQLARNWMTLFPGVEATRVALERAITEAEHGRLSIWDARLLATVEEAGCTVMLSEDMQDGMRLGNIVVRNPFAGNDLSASAKQVLGL